MAGGEEHVVAPAVPDEPRDDAPLVVLLHHREESDAAAAAVAEGQHVGPRQAHHEMLQLAFVPEPLGHELLLVLELVGVDLGLGEQHVLVRVHVVVLYACREAARIDDRAARRRNRNVVHHRWAQGTLWQL